MNRQSEQLTRINRLLRNQKEDIARMNIFPDDSEDNALNSKGKITRNNYKCFKKIDKVDEMIKKAKEINIDMLDKNKKAL